MSSVPTVDHNNPSLPFGARRAAIRDSIVSPPARPVKTSRDNSGAPSVGGLFQTNRLKIVATYTLFVIENLLRLAQPFALGWAINDLLGNRLTGLFVLVGQHVLHLIVGLIRQVYDTRTFSRIYSDLATKLILRQRADGVDVSRVAARSTLAREYVDFFERTVPTLIRVAFSVIGSVIMLGFYDWIVVLLSLALLGPAAWLNRMFAKKIRKLSRGLHDELEREVDVIEPADESNVRQHFADVAGWRIRQSNAEAINFGLMEAFVLAVIVGVLIRTCHMPLIEAGDIFAVFRYLMLMLIGIDQVPRVVHQISRMRDVDERIKARA